MKEEDSNGTIRIQYRTRNIQIQQWEAKPDFLTVYSSENGDANTIKHYEKSKDT